MLANCILIGLRGPGSDEG